VRAIIFLQDYRAVGGLIFRIAGLLLPASQGATNIAIALI